MELVCTGACIFGKCPHKKCIKFLNKEKTAVQIKTGMNILTTGDMPNITPDKQGLGLAIDIGTTTVVVYLYQIENCKCMRTSSRINAQVSLAVDVISRIKYCTDNPNGLEKLNEAIIVELNSLIKEVLEDVSADEIKHMVITGNTTMLHLLQKLSPVSMGHTPFEPESYFGNTLKATELGLELSNAECYLSPCISAFVGGDITSATIAADIQNSEDICLLMDIGTNGEVILGNKDFMLSTSTAAGPAFEGSQITCGMAGVKGAINVVDVLDGKLITSVIGEVKPIGLCGSGLLDAISLMLDLGVIDETGRINQAEEFGDLVKKGPDGISIYITDEVFIAQKDIRELQTAKSAVAAGVKCLIKESGYTVDDIKKVYIAGGFGNYMNKESALKIGLLSKEFADKTVSIGNAAGSGASMALLNNDYKTATEKISKLAKPVELGGNPYFMEKYVECMYFSNED